jgi:hypothetical protein
MSMLPEILETTVKNETRNAKADDLDDPDEGGLKQWEIQNDVETLHERLVNSSKLVQQGLHFFLLVLELVQPKHLDKQKKPHGVSAARDEEARGETLSPDPRGFPSRFEQELHKCCSCRRRWHHLRHFQL